MARVQKNLALEPEVAQELEKLAKVMGMSVSATANGILRSVLWSKPETFVGVLFQSVIDKGLATTDDLISEIKKEVDAIHNES